MAEQRLPEPTVPLNLTEHQATLVRGALRMAVHHYEDQHQPVLSMQLGALEDRADAIIEAFARGRLW